MARRHQSYNWRYMGVLPRKTSAIGGRKSAETRFIEKAQSKVAISYHTEVAILAGHGAGIAFLRAERQWRDSMNAPKRIWTSILAGSLLVFAPALAGVGRQNSDAAKTNTQQASAERDGGHDF